MRPLTTLALLLCATLALPGCGCGGDEGLVAGLAPLPQPAPVIRAGGIVFRNGILVRAPQTRMLGERDPLGNPIPGIIVEIWQNGEQIGTATTNGEGQYIFSDSNVTGGLMPSTAYEMRLSIPTNGQTIGPFMPVPPNQGSDDQTDSDGDPSIDDGYLVAPFTTPATDGNDFSIDFGFQSDIQDEG